jgi:hypothetical protein
MMRRWSLPYSNLTAKEGRKEEEEKKAVNELTSVVCSRGAVVLCLVVSATCCRLADMLMCV